jgi:hypothetical protein
MLLCIYLNIVNASCVAKSFDVNARIIIPVPKLYGRLEHGSTMMPSSPGCCPVVATFPDLIILHLPADEEASP